MCSDESTGSCFIEVAPQATGSRSHRNTYARRASKSWMPKKTFMRGRSYKMSRISLVLIFGLATVFGLETALAQGTAQKAPAAPAKAAAGTKSKGRAVLATDPVITIEGLCAGATSDAGACRTLVSRRDFESFLKALSATTAGVEPAVYRKIAVNYFSLLLYAESGQKAGVDKDPRFEQVMEAILLRALAH